MIQHVRNLGLPFVLAVCCGCPQPNAQPNAKPNAQPNAPENVVQSVTAPTAEETASADISSLISAAPGVRDDPSEDGWQSEVFSRQAQELIERLLGSFKMPQGAFR